MMGKRAASRLVMVSGMSEELCRKKKGTVEPPRLRAVLLEQEASAAISSLHAGPLWGLIVCLKALANVMLSTTQVYNDRCCN